MRYSAVAGIATTRTRITDGDGDTRKGDIPLEASDLFNDLRKGMHTDDKGTWYTAHYTITRPGRFSSDFDYDSEPQFAFEVDPRTYYEDLERFPCPFESLPEWLQGKLAKALEMLKNQEGSA